MADIHAIRFARTRTAAEVPSVSRLSRNEPSTTEAPLICPQIAGPRFPRVLGPLLSALVGISRQPVSVAQAAIDALSGPGRMPAEAEALLDWMRRDPVRWQTSSLTANGS